MGIGKNLELILKERGMSLKELSREANISYNTLYAIVKRDSANINYEVFIRICNILNIRPEIFVEKAETEKLKGNNIVSISNENSLIYNFNKLNDNGQDEAVKRVTELTKLEEYKKNNN